MITSKDIIRLLLVTAGTGHYQESISTWSSITTSTSSSSCFFFPTSSFKCHLEFIRKQQNRFKNYYLSLIIMSPLGLGSPNKDITSPPPTTQTSDVLSPFQLNSTHTLLPPPPPVLLLPPDPTPGSFLDDDTSSDEGN